jgi:hexaprenyl-diphosphate synthase
VLLEAEKSTKYTSIAHSMVQTIPGGAMILEGLKAKRSKEDVTSSVKKLLGDALCFLPQNIQNMVKCEHPVLNTAASYYFHQQGKNLRPILVLLWSKALESLYGKHDMIYKKQKRLAEVTEMIHTASLFHDDVIDRAETRRSVSTINVLFGNKVAILSGDFLLAKASIALAHLNSLKAVELMASAIENLVEGEMMQFKISSKDMLSFDYYLKKTYLKTASLIVKSLEAAAELSGCKFEHMELAARFGEHLGLAFQLVDDMLDYTATSEELGKPIANDLHLGVATAPVLFAAEDYPELLSLVKRQFQEEGDAARAKDIVINSKGIESTRRLAESHCERAVQILMKLPESEARNLLIEITQSIISRKR